MRIALDTNRYVDLARGDEDLHQILERATNVLLPFVVLAELRSGFALGSLGRQNEATLRQFLAMDDVSVVFPTDVTTQHYANLYRQLRQQGTPIPTNDIWIAALVAEHDVHLCTRDKHFDNLPQLSRV